MTWPGDLNKGRGEMRSTIHTRAQVTKQWTAEAVLRQSRQWVSPWYPPTARHVVVDDYEFYVQDAKATLMTHCAVRPDRSSIAGAMCAASQSGADTLTVTFGAQPAGDELSLADLAEFGDTEHVGTTDVLALNLDGFDPADVPVPAGISVDTVGTLKQFAEYERTSACLPGISCRPAQRCRQSGRYLGADACRAHLFAHPSSTWIPQVWRAANIPI